MIHDAGLLRIPSGQLEGFHRFLRRFWSSSLDNRVNNHVLPGFWTYLTFPLDIDRDMCQAYAEFALVERVRARLLALANWLRL